MDTTLLTRTQVAKMVDEYVHEIISERVAQSGRLSASYQRLWLEIERVYNAGGKRIRPYLTMLAWQLYAGHPDDFTAIIPAAVAHECIHLGMLVHDDIIDRDDKRRGELTINGSYKHHYTSGQFRPIDTVHAANSAALLAGDALISEAFYQLRKVEHVDGDTQLKALGYFHDAVFTVIGGELLDTESAELPNERAHDVDVKAIAEQKTASYSFQSPLLVGATLAGAPDDQCELLRQFGMHVGLGFQYRDDMLGIFGDEQDTGKSINGDIIEGKVTVIVQEFLSRATKVQRNAFYHIFGSRDATSDQCNQVRALLREIGIDAIIEARIDTKLENAYTCVDKMNISDHGRERLREIAATSMKRSS